MHKFITLVFTGKKLILEIILVSLVMTLEKFLRRRHCGVVFQEHLKKIENFNEIDSIRGVRYFGPSKMSLLKLIIHSFAIIAVFKFTVFFRIFINGNLNLFKKFFCYIFCIISDINFKFWISNFFSLFEGE